MLQALWGDVTGIFQSVFLQGDLISLAIAFGSVVIAALMMQRAGQLVTTTLTAVFLFFAASFVRTLFSAPATGGGSVGGRAVNQLQSGWGQFMDMQASSLLAYFLAFMLLTLVLFVLKSVVSRG